MASPTIFSGNYTKLLTSGGVQMQNGMILQNEGPINYIKNYGAEVGTTGWATYSNTAGNIPLGGGTGGTATGLTFSRSTSSPLVGAGQFSMVQANSTSLQGKGVSYDFTIDPAYKAQSLAIRFSYNASSTFVASNGTTAPLNDGTTSTNAGNSDVEVFIYDVTNSVLIPVSPQVIVGNGSNNFQFNGTFQTSSNSTSYRLIFHVATTSANATGWTFLFDRVYVGPQTLVQGAPLTDPITFTPVTTGLGTLSAVTAYYYREGKFMIGEITATAGTVTGSTFDLTIPGGLSVDTAYMSSTSSAQTVGYLDHATSGSTTIPSNSNGPFYIFYDGSTTTKLYCANATTGQAYSKNTGSSILSNSNPFTIKFRVPISGWSSNVMMSNDSATSVVAARGYRSAALSGLNPNNTSVKINIDAVNGDTNGAWDTANSKYVIPVSGWYNLDFAITINSTNVLNAQYQAVVYKNGSLLNYGQSIYPPSTNGFKAIGSYKGQFVAGDYLELYLYGAGNNSASTLTAAVGATNVYLEVERISGPTTIATQDTVACSYWATGNTSVSTSVPINFDSKVYDYTNSTTTGANWKYTAPVSGLYQLSMYVNVTGTANQNLVLYKNGSAYQILVYMNTGNASSICSTIKLLAGDYIDIRGSGALTVTGNATQSNSSSSNIQIARIGN